MSDGNLPRRRTISLRGTVARVWQSTTLSSLRFACRPSGLSFFTRTLQGRFLCSRVLVIAAMMPAARRRLYRSAWTTTADLRLRVTCPSLMNGKAISTTSPRPTSIIVVVDVQAGIIPRLGQGLLLQPQSFGVRPGVRQFGEFSCNQIRDDFAHWAVATGCEQVKCPRSLSGDVHALPTCHWQSPKDDVR